jgi:uncharacterized protein
MKFFGEDFRAAKRNWLYDASGAQSLLVAAGFAVGLLVLHVVLQLIFAAIIAAILSGGQIPARGTDAATTITTRAAVIALLPEGILIALVAWLFARLFNRNPRDVLALRLPQLGIFGWLLVVAGFVVAVSLWNLGAMKALGIDASTYMPSSEGLADKASSSGVVEKTIAGMVNEPRLFWVALPAVMFGAPIAEEFIFRGAIFSALLKSGFGKIATVVVTSALWAVLHALGAPWMFVLLIFGMGLMLGALLLRFGSLWVTIACHCTWNMLTMFAISNFVQR